MVDAVVEPELLATERSALRGAVSIAQVPVGNHETANAAGKLVDIEFLETAVVGVDGGGDSVDGGHCWDVIAEEIKMNRTRLKEWSEKRACAVGEGESDGG